MAVLSIGIIAINKALHQAVITRASAQDYTCARFLLDDLMADLELQAQLVESDESGDFGEEYPRFSWRKQVSELEIQAPDPPDGVPENLLDQLSQGRQSMGLIRVTVYWERAGQSYERTAQTVISQRKLWLPIEEEGELDAEG